MKCKCAEYGITKFRFVKGTTARAKTAKKVKDYYWSNFKNKSPFIYILTYCVKQREKTQCVPGSETYVITKNGRPAMKCKCAECGITKFRFF